MQKLTQSLNLKQKLSPQQIQFLGLLQIPIIDLDKRIETEIEENPVLEEDEETLKDIVEEFSKNGEEIE